MKKPILRALCASLLLCCTLAAAATCALALNVVQPTELFYAADYAGVLSEDTVNHIVTRNDALYEQTGAQIVVVTVDTVGSYEMEDYAYALFNDWGIGGKDKNNGVLLLLSIGDDDYFYTVGRGLEGKLSVGALDELADTYLEPDFAARDYDAGVYRMFDALYAAIEKLYGRVESSGGAAGGVVPGGYDDGGYGYEYGFNALGLVGSAVKGIVLLFVAIIVLAVVLSIVFGTRSRRMHRRYGPTYNPYRRPGPPPPGGPPIDFGGMGPRPPRRSSGNFWGGFGMGMYMGSRGSSNRRSGGGFGGSSGSRSSFSGGSRSSGSSSRSRSGGGGSSRGGGGGRGRH